MTFTQRDMGKTIHTRHSKNMPELKEEWDKMPN